ARPIAEKIRISLSTPYLQSLTIEHRCTASNGVTLFKGREASEEHVIESADSAMYQAKEHGLNTIRNCE
ncbi:diguanylate cyclase, partial [Pseudomonas sp. 5B4]